MMKLAAIGVAALGVANAIDVDVFSSTTCETADKLNTLGTFKISNNGCDVVPDGNNDDYWSITCADDMSGDWTFTTHGNDPLCAASATSTVDGNGMACVAGGGLGFIVNCSAAVGLSPQNTIVNNAVAAGMLSTLTSVLTTSAYDPVRSTLNTAALNATVFAPNNAAFTAAINANRVNTSMVDLTTAVLQYHVVTPGTFAAGDLASLQFPATALSNSDYENVPGAQVVRVAKSAGGTVTVSWSIPSDVSTVVLADVACSNGIVHVVDTVLGLPQLVSTTATAAGLTALVDAVVATNITNTVNTATPTTIFAPTNAAFDKADIPANATIADITSVLQAHAVNARAFSNELTDGMTVTDLAGGTLVISVDSATGAVSVNGSNVIIADVLTDTGVVHVIDKVIGVADKPDDSPAFAATASAATASFLGLAVAAATLL